MPLLCLFVTTSCFYCITFSHCQLAANRLGDYFPLPSLPPSSLVNCHIFPPLSPSFIDLVYNVRTMLKQILSDQQVPTEDGYSECHQAAASDLCGRHHWTCANISLELFWGWDIQIYGVLSTAAASSIWCRLGRSYGLELLWLSKMWPDLRR